MYGALTVRSKYVLLSTSFSYTVLSPVLFAFEVIGDQEFCLYSSCRTDFAKPVILLLLSTVEILLVVELTSEPETVVVTFVFVVTVTVSPGNMSWAAEHKGKEAAATRIGRDSRVLMFGCMIIVKNSFQEVGLFLPTY